MRKYQINDSVVLSNPSTSRGKRFLDQEFQVSGYTSGDSKPYRIFNISGNVLYVSAKEISPVVETPVELAPEDENPTTNDALVLIEETLTPNEIAEKNLFIEDEVLITFKPTQELAATLGVYDHLEYWNRFGSQMDNYIGKVGKISSIGNGYTGVKFPDTYVYYYPSTSLLVTKKGGGLFKFKASADYSATIFKNKIMVDESTNIYSFELFDRLWEAVKQHKANPRRGYGRKITLENSWEGSFHDTYLAVGCQRFPYDNIRRLVALIRKVRSMNK